MGGINLHILCYQQKIHNNAIQTYHKFNVLYIKLIIFYKGLYSRGFIWLHVASFISSDNPPRKFKDLLARLWSTKE
jgi:hypothetical protein